MPKQLLSAEDLSFILKYYKFNDAKVSIIGCPKHLYKSLLHDKNKKIKAYICHINNHWFMIFYVRLKKQNVIITWDSLGNPLNPSYRHEIVHFDPNTEFKYCSAVLQRDTYNCGWFCITFILIIFDCYKKHKKLFLENVNKIQRASVLQKLSLIKKTL